MSSYRYATFPSNPVRDVSRPAAANQDGLIPSVSLLCSANPTRDVDSLAIVPAMARDSALLTEAYQ